MRVLLELAFPRACLSCRAPGHRGLCPSCDEAFPWIAASCERCGRPAARPVERCPDCRDPEPAFDVARAAAVYTGVARDALMTFKLGGERRSAGLLAPRMALAARPLQADLLTFVPSTHRTVAARGYNPAAELAGALAPRLRIPLRPLLEKVRETVDQSELGRQARHRNLRDAFCARRVTGRILLIDDVMTTGATAHACSLALRSAGASGVAVLTFARAR